MKNMSRRIFSIKEGWSAVTLCLVVVFSLVVAGVIMGCVPPEDNSGSMTFILQAEEYAVAKDEEGFDIIEMQGFSPSTSPGDPTLPYKVYNIAVPPDIVWSSLKLDIVSVESHLLERTYDIKPAPPFIPMAEGDDTELKEEWGAGKDIANGKNMNVYGLNASFPESCVTLLSYSQMRKWEFIKVDFTPFQYNPASKELTLIESATMKISYDRSGAELDASLMGDEVMDHVASQILFNYETAEPWYEPESPINGKPQYDYVIVTTQYILQHLSAMMTPFRAHKQNQGHSVLIITEQDWDVSGAQPPDGRAERIRKWLMDNYISMGIKYVLLVGDPTPVEFGSGPEYPELSIPMKGCWPWGPKTNPDAEIDQLPTDYFYADLSGNWDYDGDTYYGEDVGDRVNSNSQPIEGGVDFYPEVYVGRIPVYDPFISSEGLDVDLILQKIIDYETDTNIAWRKSALLPMSSYSGAGSCDQLGEDMINGYLTGEGFSSWRQYQQGDGAILHYDGTSWTPMTSDSTASLNDVCGILSNDFFAVGEKGTILHYDGSHWTSMTSPTTEDLNGVWGILSNDVFAVGEKGTILHYDGKDWTSMASPTTRSLNDVWGILSNDVFAVGDYGTVLHYNGTDWSSMTSGTYSQLNDIWGILSNDVFAVGNVGTILHYNGTDWTSMTSDTTERLNGIWGILSNYVFAVGDYGTVLHYNGTDWTKMDLEYVPDPPKGWDLYSVWGNLSNNFFAVGRNGIIFHYDGNGWFRMDSTWRHLYGVWGILSNDVFAVGWNGACLQTKYSPEENLRGDSVVRDRWAANDYGIVCWGGHGSSQLTRIGYATECWDGLLFQSDDCLALDDDHPAFVFQGSCDNGWPEDPINLQYSILKQGGIATVAATRASWWWGIKNYAYNYIEGLVAGVPAAEALYLTKSDLGAKAYLPNLYVFNLYGDPSTSLGT